MSTLPKRNPHHKRSRLQERRGAKEYGGTVNAGSGNGWIRKADVRTDSELFEFKTTTKSSFPLKSTDLQKFWTQGLIDNRFPVFEVEFANDGVTCVVLEKADYLMLRNYWRENG